MKSIKTAASTKEIADIIKAFHDDIVYAINSIERSSTAVEEGVASSAEALTVLKKIGQSTDQTAEMAKKIGERGQRKVRADFSFEKMKEKYQSVYYNSIN